jgi:phage-related minor tail protein
MIGLYQELSDSIKNIDDLIDTTDAEEVNNGEEDKLKYWEDRAKEQESAADALVNATEKLAEANGTATPEWEKYAKSLEDMASAEGVLPETAKALRDAAKAWREYNQAQEDAAWGTQANIGGGYERPEPKGTSQYHQETWQEEYLSNMQTFSEQAEQLAQNTADNIQNSLGDGIYDLITGQWKNIGDVFKNLCQNILRDLANMYASQLMQSFMKNGLGKLLQNNHGTGSAGGWVNDEYGGHVEYRATGGPVSAFAPYVVGENGPEMFVPNSSGSIVSNDKLGSLAPEIQINNINQTGVPTKSRVQSTQFDGKRYVVNVLTEAIADNTGGIRDTLASRR